MAHFRQLKHSSTTISMILVAVKYWVGRLTPFFPAFLVKSRKLPAQVHRPGGDEGTERAKAAALGFNAAQWGAGLAISKSQMLIYFYPVSGSLRRYFIQVMCFHHCRIELMNLIVLIV